MGAKRYFFIVWLAFAVPWITGTGFGVYNESRMSADEISDAAAGSCASGHKGEQPGIAGSMECREKALASLAGRAMEAAGGAIEADTSRSADTVEPVHDFVDGAFILGPPLLLFIVYSVSFLAARRVGSEQEADTDQGE
jgi:hypothetical protein